MLMIAIVIYDEGEGDVNSDDDNEDDDIAHDDYSTEKISN